MHPMLNIAIRAARSAGNVITRGFENRDDLAINAKSDNVFSTKIDKDAEQAIIEKIKQSYPDHSFVGEEGGIVEGDADFKWIIDPLDGTTNFIKGIPHFSVSIALMHKGRIDQAVIFDPIRGDLFTASKGNGAQLNGYKIRVSKNKDLHGTILGTCLPYKNKADLADYLPRFTRIFAQSGDVRRSGSVALDLAYVAAGKLDGYFASDLKPWDVAAGDLIIREAGGLITDYAGGNDPMHKGEMVAANPRVVQQLVKLLK